MHEYEIQYKNYRGLQFYNKGQPRKPLTLEEKLDRLDKVWCKCIFYDGLNFLDSKGSKHKEVTDDFRDIEEYNTYPVLAIHMVKYMTKQGIRKEFGKYLCHPDSHHFQYAVLPKYTGNGPRSSLTDTSVETSSDKIIDL